MFGGLTQPTTLRFASDGRVFVAEKSGLIKVFSDVSDTTPTVFADLRGKVHDFWDRGLLSIELAPGFPADPWVYLLYTYDAPVGGAPPTWGDGCVNPPGATEDGCVVSGRLSRIQAAGDVSTGAEQVLINDWCAQPLDRGPGLRPGRRPLRERGRRRQLPVRGLRSAGNPQEPLRRPAERRRWHPDPARRRGRRPALAGPAHVRRPGHARRHGHQDRPGHRRGAAGQPARRQRGPQRPPDRRAGPAQPLPHRLPPRHRRALGGRCRLVRARGAQSRRRPDGRGQELRLALLRGPRGASRATTPWTCRSARASTTRPAR